MNQPGPFERQRDSGAPRDKSARTVLIAMGVLGALLLILVLPPISLLSGDDGGGLPTTVSSGGAPRVPEGLEALSRVFKQDKPKDPGPYDVTVPLLQQANDARNLGFYTNRSGKWELLTNATLTDGGRAATGQLSAMPDNLVVLRRTASVVQISGFLAPGAQLDQGALDVLTTLNPIAFTPAPDGALVGSLPPLPAINGNVMPTVRAVEQRDIDSVNAILASPALRDAHIAALVQLAQQQGVAGIDLDYQRINTARKGDFNTFVTALSERLHQAERSLSLSLPAPVKTGVNWDTGAYDWEELARRADVLKLSPEIDPSIYHKRMEEVLTFLKDRIDLKKVQLIVSRASVEKGTDGLRTLTLQEGLTLASDMEVRTTTQITPNTSVVVVGKNIFQDDGATGIGWDGEALAVSFSYPGRAGQRTVWLENAFSLAFRVDLARHFGLAGIALDDVSNSPALPAVWMPLRTYAQTGSIPLVQPNSALLKPSWQVQAGSHDVGAKGNIVWRAPQQPGGYDIGLVVSDGIVRAMQKIVLEVRPAGATPAAVGTPRPGASPTPRP